MIFSYIPFCECKLKSITFPKFNLVFKFKIKGLDPGYFMGRGGEDGEAEKDKIA